MIDKNFVVINKYYDQDLLVLFFGGEDVSAVDQNTDMYDVLVMAGIFSSKSQARKNWTRTGKDIPAGFNHFEKIGRLHHSVCVWNPIGG
jgi:hypothetical protein